MLAKKYFTYRTALMLISLFGVMQLEAQNKIDSLKKIIYSNKNDTLKVLAMFEWDNLIYLDDPITDLMLNQKIEKKCEKKLVQNNSTKEKIFYKKYLSKAKNNIGLIFFEQGDYVKAIDYFSICLSIGEELKDVYASALSLGNLANIYYEIGEDDKAVEYYTKSLNLFKKLNDRPKMALTLNHLANVNADNKQSLKAIQNYRLSYNISMQIEDSLGMARTLTNIGNVYRDLRLFDSSLTYLNKGLLLRQYMNDKKGIVASMNSMGITLVAKKEYKNAIAILEKNKNLAKDINSMIELREVYQVLSNCYENSGDYKNALIHYQLYNKMKDSILSEENTRAAIQREYKYNYEKKSAEDKIKANEEKKLHKARMAESRANLNYEKTKQYALYVGLFIMLLFIAIVFNRYKVVKRQKLIIEEKEKETQQQKKIIEVKASELAARHKEITDSINYAERIQRSFLATQEILDKNLEDYFVYYKPKDIVSGDFYWASKLNNDNFIICCADSTGHGVPGAIMSILNISSLEKSIETKTNPEEILNETRGIIIERLKKDGSPEGGKDGMDATLVVLNKDRTKMYCAAANNPVWILRNKEIIEIEPDKMPVGKHDKDTVSFVKKEIDLLKGDLIYTLTDGMPDQFGGKKGKKYKYTKLKEFLITVSTLSLAQQKNELDNEFEEWKGDLEQVDDVCVIGIRV